MMTQLGPSKWVYKCCQTIFANCLVNHFTLRPSGTLLFSGLPMMIWQKNLQTIFAFEDFESYWQNLWNQSPNKVTSMTWQIFFLRALLQKSSFKMVSLKPSAGQTHGLILPIFVFFYNRFKSILCRRSRFHREWLLFSRISMVLKFPCISKFKILHILIESSHSRWKQLVLQRNRDRTDIIEKKWTKSIHAFALQIDLKAFLKTNSSEKACTKQKICQIIWVTFFVL